jgi:hypothetical protein
MTTRLCTLPLKYETSAPTSTSDRVCGTVTTCASGYFESVAATATSDAQCAPLSTCHAAQYQSVAPSYTNNRVCSLLTPCNPGQFALAAPTATSNWQCTFCPAGSTDHDFDSLTECLACGAGMYVPPGATGACSLFACPAFAYPMSCPHSSSCLQARCRC